MRYAVAVAMLVGLASGAEAATIINGSFEQGSFRGLARGGSGRAALTAGTDFAAVPGWTIFGTGLANVLTNQWSASDGVSSFDLAALGNGGIMQRVAGLEIGRRYRLTFDLSANPFGQPDRRHGNRVLVSSTATTPQIYSYFLDSTNTASNMQYATHSYDFVAVRNSQLVRFSNLSPDAFGVVLDNVQLSAVPDAASWGLLLAGFGLVGVVARRRRDTRSVAA